MKKLETRGWVEHKRKKLKKANKEIISSHMKHCVLDASDEDASIKIDEMIQIINQMMK